MRRLHAPRARHGSRSVPRRRADGRRRPEPRRRVRVGGGARAAVVPVDAVRGARRAGSRPRPRAARADAPAAARRPRPRDLHGQRPADLERAVRHARDRARGCRCSTSSAGRDPGSRGPRCRPGSAPSACRTRPHWRESAELADFDRALLGFATRRTTGSSRTSHGTPFAFRRTDGALLGYGYAGEIGRIGPIAVADPTLLTPALGHLLAAIEPRGASAVWLPGAADDALGTAVEAGLRIEGFPILAGWSRAVHRFHPIRTNLPRTDLIGS